MIFALCTHIGQVRQRNEDNAYIPMPGWPLFIAVADGMGGHNAGEKASAMAIATLTECLAGENSLPAKALVGAIRKANSVIFTHAKSDPACRGMGTTLTAAIFDGSTLYAANVGDSRAYLLSGGAFTQLTVDHSLVEELVLSGHLTREQAEVSPQRNIITRALGTSSGVNADIFEASWEEGDVILLCTDGLTTHISDADIQAVLENGDTLQERADALVGLANERGGRDNITVVIAQRKEARA